MTFCILTTGGYSSVVVEPAIRKSECCQDGHAGACPAIRERVHAMRTGSRRQRWRLGNPTQVIAGEYNVQRPAALDRIEMPQAAIDRIAGLGMRR
jgi:hypothetical protein